MNLSNTAVGSSFVGWIPYDVFVLQLGESGLGLIAMLSWRHINHRVDPHASGISKFCEKKKISNACQLLHLTFHVVCTASHTSVSVTVKIWQCPAINPHTKRSCATICRYRRAKRAKLWPEGAALRAIFTVTGTLNAFWDLEKTRSSLSSLNGLSGYSLCHWFCPPLG